MANRAYLHSCVRWVGLVCILYGLILITQGIFAIITNQNLLLALHGLRIIPVPNYWVAGIVWTALGVGGLTVGFLANSRTTRTVQEI